jgi:hypothetical protein
LICSFSVALNIRQILIRFRSSRSNHLL